MKRKLLTLLLVLSAASAFSQMNGDYNYSIGVRGFSMIQMPRVMNETDFSEYTTSYFNGAMLKFNDNQISYRLSGSYIKKSKTAFNNCNTCEEIRGEISDYAFKIGFEKNLNFSVLQPYFGADLGYRSNKFIGQLQNVNSLKSAVTDVPQVKIEATKSGFVASPVLGLKINVIRELSFFAETSMDFFYSYERQDEITEDANNNRNLRKNYKSEFLLNPISVGIMIHLGSNK